MIFGLNTETQGCGDAERFKDELNLLAPRPGTLEAKPRFGNARCWSNSMESAHWAVLAALVSQIPTTIVCVGGIVWVLLRLEQQRRPAFFLLAGLSLYLLLGISQLFLQGPLQLLLSSLV